VLNEIEKRLVSVGSSMDKVLKVNVYLNTLDDYAGITKPISAASAPNRRCGQRSPRQRGYRETRSWRSTASRLSDSAPLRASRRCATPLAARRSVVLPAGTHPPSLHCASAREAAARTRPAGRQIVSPQGSRGLLARLRVRWPARSDATAWRLPRSASLGDVSPTVEESAPVRPSTQLACANSDRKHAVAT
jgi:hypothetical protein